MPIRVRVPVSDLKQQSGAYLTLNRQLYEVIGFEATGPSSGRLHVLNSRTLYPQWFKREEVERAELVRAAI